MRRMLILGASGPGTIESFLASALRSLGVAVDEVDPCSCVSTLQKSAILNRATWRFQHLPIGRSVLDTMERNPGWDTVLVVKGYFLAPDVLRSARRKAPHAQWVCFNPDSPFDPGRSTSSTHIRAAIPLFDMYLIWSRALIEPLKSAGCRRVEYLPFAYSTDAHFPAEVEDPSLARRVTFVGSYDQQRAALLEQIADLPIRIYGNGWQKLRPTSPLLPKVRQGALFGERLRTVVTSSAASINILRPQNVDSHNMRTFEVPAMGGLLLTTRSSEQKEFFPEKVASLMYSNATELREQIEGILSGRLATQAIRANALRLCAGQSYRDRAETIMALLSSSGSPGC